MSHGVRSEHLTDMMCISRVSHCSTQTLRGETYGGAVISSAFIEMWKESRRFTSFELMTKLKVHIKEALILMQLVNPEKDINMDKAWETRRRSTQIKQNLSSG